MNTYEKRARRFQQGLKPWIRSKVTMFELSTYDTVVHNSMIIEGESEQYNREVKKRKVGGSQGQGSTQSQFTKKAGFQQGKNVRFRRPKIGLAKQSSQQPNVHQPRLPRPPLAYCKVCGKKHTRVCGKANIVCFKWNKNGHYSNECKSQKPLILCNRCGKHRHISKNYRAWIPVTC